MKTLLSLAALFATVSLGLAAPVTGEPAPGFSLPGADGKTHALSDYKGKYIVLEWINHGCPFVKKHYESGNMQALQKEAAAKGVVWFSVSSATPGKQGHLSAVEWNAVTKEKGATPATVLIDADGKVGKSYGAKTTPQMFVINPEGKLIYQGAIDSIASTDKEDVAKATNYVKAAIEEAMAGKPVTNAETKPYGCGVKY